MSKQENGHPKDPGDEAFEPSATIVHFGEKGNPFLILLVNHALGRNWIAFSPDWMPDVDTALERAVAYAHNFGIEQIEVRFVSEEECMLFPDDFE